MLMWAKLLFALSAVNQVSYSNEVFFFFIQCFNNSEKVKKQP